MNRTTKTLVNDSEESLKIESEIEALKEKAQTAAKDSSDIWVPLGILFLIIAITIYYNLQNTTEND